MELTVAHGGWQSGAHSRYHRFAHRAVLSIPARMLGKDSVFDDGSGQRVVGRGRVQRGSSVAPDAESDESDEESGSVGDAELASGPPPHASHAVPDASPSIPEGLPPGVQHKRQVASSGRLCASMHLLTALCPFVFCRSSF